MFIGTRGHSIHFQEYFRECRTLHDLKVGRKMFPCLNLFFSRQSVASKNDIDLSKNKNIHCGLKDHPFANGCAQREKRSDGSPPRCLRQNPKNAVMHLGHDKARVMESRLGQTGWQRHRCERLDPS